MEPGISSMELVGMGGGTDPARFHIYLHNEPALEVWGAFVAEEPLTHLAYTWSWTTKIRVGTDAPILGKAHHDLVTGEITVPAINQPKRAVPSRMPPARQLPSTSACAVTAREQQR